jgi:hypothetical protein
MVYLNPKGTCPKCLKPLEKSIIDAWVDCGYYQELLKSKQKGE